MYALSSKVDSGGHYREPRDPRKTTGHRKHQARDTKGYRGDTTQDYQYSPRSIRDEVTPPREEEFTLQVPDYYDQAYPDATEEARHYPVTSNSDVRESTPPRNNSPPSYPAEAPSHTIATPRHRATTNKDIPEQYTHKLPRFGTADECKPVMPRTAEEGTIQWAWFPDWSWLKVLVGVCSTLSALGFVLLIFGIVNDGAVLLAFGIILMVVGLACTWLFHNWLWNASKQEAYKLARGKRIQALKVWNTNTCDELLFQAKDTFYETSYGGKTLRVLRDGTIEVHGYHKNKASDDAGLASAMSSLKNSGGGGGGGMEVNVDV